MVWIDKQIISEKFEDYKIDDFSFESTIDYNYREGEELPDDYEEEDNICISRILLFVWKNISYIMNRNSWTLRNMLNDAIFEYYGYSCIDINCICKLNFTNKNHKDQKIINKIKEEYVIKHNVDCDDNELATKMFMEALKLRVKPLREEIEKKYAKVQDYILNKTDYKQRGKAYFYIKKHPEMITKFKCVKDLYESPINWNNKDEVCIKAMAMLCYHHLTKNGTMPNLRDIMDFAKKELDYWKFRNKKKNSVKI